MKGHYADEVKLDDVLAELAQEKRYATRLGRWMIEEEWRKAVGDFIADHARPISLKNGILKLAVDSSTWANELAFRKEEILRQFAASAKKRGIKDVAFAVLPPRAPTEAALRVNLPPLDATTEAKILNTLKNIHNSDFRNRIEEALRKSLRLRLLWAQMLAAKEE